MRFRTDNSRKADDAARLARGVETVWYHAHELVGVAPAQPGDTWRVHWHNKDGALAGYDICCTTCLQVHSWTTALNCGSRNSEGICEHEGKSSCWEWTGSAEGGTLHASPSLYCKPPHGCGFHGFLSAGILKG